MDEIITKFKSQRFMTVRKVPGMGSSRTGLDLEDTSRTKFCGLGLGLGLGLDDARPWLWLRDLAVRRCTMQCMCDVLLS